MERRFGKVEGEGDLTEKEIIRFERNSGVVSGRVREIQKQLRLGSRSLVNETSGLEQESYKLKSVKPMSKVANNPGSEGRNGLGKPKGRAIHVEGSACKRIPSADLWRPIQRDSDVVIQVNMTLSPSNQSTSDDSSKLNHKGVATERWCTLRPGNTTLSKI